MNLKRIHEPSSGGMGTKLKMAKIILMCTTKEKIIKRPGMVIKNDSGKNRNNNPKINARAILVKGPAKETFKSPHF